MYADDDLCSTPNSPNFVNYAGRRFGTVVVQAYAGHGERPKGARWLVKCDCGEEFTTRTQWLRKGCFKCQRTDGKPTT